MKKFLAGIMVIMMILNITACGKSEQPKKGESADLGCEVSDYLFLDSEDKINKFIEDNELRYDEDNGDYFNHYISITLDEDKSSITMATLINPGNYTMFGISIGETFDRDIVTSRLNRNNLPLLSDEGDHIYYGVSGIDESPVLCIRLNNDGTVGFVLYDAKGAESVASNAEEIIDMTAPEIYRAFEDYINSEGSEFHGPLVDKALTFIDNHPDLFIGGDPNHEAANYMSNEAFDYRKYAKSAENYPLTIIWGSEMYVYDISENNITDNMCLTEGVLVDSSDGHVYYFLMPGTVDVYMGDYVDFEALPIGYGSFNNTDGGTTDCVYLAVTSMWTYEEAPDQGY